MGRFSTDMRSTGAIPAGETREIRVLEMGPNQPASSFKPSFAIWQDLIWQGSASERASVMEGRRLHAEVLAFWIGQLKAVSGMAPQAAIASLRAALEERRRNGTDRGGLMTGNLESFARTAEQNPEQLPERLEAFRRMLEEQYAQLTRSR
jgi:hypothetical protein